MKKFLITTPIYYVNAPPHVGTAYSTIASDVLARFHRMKGEEVLFSTGTDENALKVLEAARERGKDPQEFVDEMAQAFREVWDQLKISYDCFIRTTEPIHQQNVQRLVEQLYRQGDIYWGSYQGWYCKSDETFFSESELVDGCCPNPHCGRKVEWVEEQAYFFRLSAYQDRLLNYIESRPDFLRPDFRRNEVISFIKGGLQDVCISRMADWGIPVPGDLEAEAPAGMVVYVWFDALINYLTVAGYGSDDEKFERMWPADIHIMAKDIFTRFHATIWPAMLMAAGLELPQTVFAHGYWNFKGEKISKSKGELISPLEIAQSLVEESGCRFEIAIDALRYFLLREVPFGVDGDFSMEGVLGRFNSDLANDLGNLLNRTLPMIDKYCQGKIPSSPLPDQELAKAASSTVAQVDQALENIDFAEALKSTWTLVARLNKYIDQRAPWALAKQGKQEELDSVMYSIAEGIRQVALLVSPFMPSVAQAMMAQLGWDKPMADWRWENVTQWGILPGGTQVGEGEPIFPRVSKKTKAQQGGKGEEPVIGIEEFQKLDLRIGEVLAASAVPGADKLIQLTIDIGGEQRTAVAGIALCYGAQELIGKKVVVLANLQPATIRGVKSEVMILAAGEERNVVLLTPEKDVPTGTRVR